jgi:hypothetical protein
MIASGAAIIGFGATALSLVLNHPACSEHKIQSFLEDHPCMLPGYQTAGRRARSWSLGVDATTSAPMRSVSLADPDRACRHGCPGAELVES